MLFNAQYFFLTLLMNRGKTIPKKCNLFQFEIDNILNSVV
jgi:hypothetical protein